MIKTKIENKKPKKKVHFAENPSEVQSPEPRKKSKKSEKSSKALKISINEKLEDSSDSPKKSNIG